MAPHVEGVMTGRAQYLRKSTVIGLAGSVLMSSALTAFATPLSMPTRAQSGFEQVEELGSYDVPTGPWADGAVETVTAEGRVTQTVWKLPANRLTTLQILMPLREQLAEQGYQISFECEDTACGGFDFRFATTVAPEPDMHVDLGDYRFLSAVRDNDGESEAISLLVSRSVSKGFVQVMHVEPVNIENVELTVSSSSPDPDILPFVAETDLSLALEDSGFVVLEDVSFDTGSAVLQDQMVKTLTDLADYLNAYPERKVALVGHTDAEGSLDGNINLSKLRAESVMQALVADHGVAVAQLSAEGMGYLSPRASNLTDEGRALNRRVEVILTSTN